MVTVGLTDTNDPQAPHKPGIYTHADVDGKSELTKIEPSMFTKAKVDPMGEALKARLSGKDASLRVPVRQPTFYFFFGENESALSDTNGAAGFTLSKLEVKKSKSERRLVITTGNEKKKNTVDLTIEKTVNSTLKVTPSVDLADGEYCFVYLGMTPPKSYGLVPGNYGLAFCFSVQSSAPMSPKQKQ